MLAERALSPASTKALLTNALETSQVLAEAFGEEAVWVETAPESIVLPASGDAVTFWACPLKWLGSPEKRDGLLPLARLVEKALHWRGKPVAGTAEGLGSWVKAVREDPVRWTLEEALAALNEPSSIVSLPVSKGGVPTVPMPSGKKKAAAARKRPVVPVLLAVLVAVAAAGGGLYFLKHRLAQGAALAGSGREKQAGNPKRTSALDFAAGPKAEEAAVTGRVTGTEESEGSETRYLKIAVEGALEPRWVAYQVSRQAEGMELSDLKELEDRRVRINGDEKAEDSHRKTVVQIRSRD